MPALHIEKSRGEDGKEQIQVVEEAQVAPWERDATFSVVGRGVPRVEGVEKVTGRARYSYDIRLPGQLYARVLRKPARARADRQHRYQSRGGATGRLCDPQREQCAADHLVQG